MNFELFFLFATALANTSKHMKIPLISEEEHRNSLYTKRDMWGKGPLSHAFDSIKLYSIERLIKHGLWHKII